MLLGKRPRPPMRRTSSMTGITVDVENSDDGIHHITGGPNSAPTTNFIPITTTASNTSGNFGPYDYNVQNYLSTTALVSPRRNPFGTSKQMETPQFLRICGLCQGRLVPGRDIYMYRGDTAFCSFECREQQIKQDERKEKRASASK